MYTIESTLVELVFRPARQHEAHTMICQQGRCSPELLRLWTSEFQPFHSRNCRSEAELMMTFSRTEPGIPVNYRVKFERKGREVMARLISVPNALEHTHQTMLSVPALPALQSEPVPDPGSEPALESNPELQTAGQVGGDWRSEMLHELELFIRTIARNETDRACLNFACGRMRSLAEAKPQHFTLTVFGAFIAGTDSDAMREQDPAGYHLFQAAAAVLQLAVADSEEFTNITPAMTPKPGDVWATIRSMIGRWMPARNH